MPRTRKIKGHVKILWMYWDKGIENITDPYNKMCFDGWKLLNPDWDIRILNEKTVSNYIDNFNDFEGCIVQHQADILRIKLLEKYGGVWADASTLPMKPLTGNITHMDKGTGIFFYRYIPADSNCYISNWFIISKQPHHYLIKKLVHALEKKFKKNKIQPYFIFHYTLTDLYKDVKIKKIIDKLTITQDLSHAPQHNKKYPPLTSSVSEQPLCYKRATKITRQMYSTYLKDKFNIIY
jgi:mannosyltransferase OCH1-like enzyme